jgi:CRP-like cAMP-binding protein
MVTQDTGSRLSGIRLIRELPPQRLQLLERRCSWRRYGPGEQILDRDSESRDVFLVVDGTVEVVNYSITGREVAFGRVRAGGYFGELAAIDGRRRSANVVATEPSTLAVMPPDVFIGMLTEHPSIALHVLRRLAHIVRTADERIMDLSTLKAVQRVYVELLRLVQETASEEGGLVISPIPTQRELARRASTSRETVARVLSQLIKGGIIARKGRSVRVMDPDRLRMLALPDQDDEEA